MTYSNELQLVVAVANTSCYYTTTTGSIPKLNITMEYNVF